jgi:hypothetical protein
MPSSVMLRHVVLVRTDNLRSGRRLLVTANVVTSSPFLVTLMMQELLFSESSVLTRATQHNIPEDGFIYVLYCVCSFVHCFAFACSAILCCLIVVLPLLLLLLLLLMKTLGVAYMNWRSTSTRKGPSD